MDITTSFDALLHETCVRLGFCNSIWKRLPKDGTMSSSDFASWTLECEGVEVDGPTWLKFFDTLKSMFLEIMGRESFDASELKEDFLIGLELIRKHAAVLQALAHSPVDHSKT